MLLPLLVVFDGVTDLDRGGTLHLSFVTTDGQRHTLALPVPPYPHDWDASS